MTTHEVFRQSAKAWYRLSFTHLVQVECAFQQFRSEGVLLLVGVQVTLGVQETLRQGAKDLPEAKVVPVGLLSSWNIPRQHLHACRLQSMPMQRLTMPINQTT